MVYNPPETGHVVIILDNGTTAMTGMQEHPGTGRKLDHSPTNTLVFEDVARAMGIPNVQVFNPTTQTEAFVEAVKHAIDSPTLSLIVARRPCILAVKKIREYAAGGAQ
jgi:indolepyruvate ferredoxin oxidoreductase alpha subunit